MISINSISEKLKDYPEYFQNIKCEGEELHFTGHLDKNYTITINQSNYILSKLKQNKIPSPFESFGILNAESVTVKISISTSIHRKYKNFHIHGKQLLYGLIAFFNNNPNPNIHVKYNSYTKKVSFIARTQCIKEEELVDKLISNYQGIIFQLGSISHEFLYVLRNIEINK